MGYPGNCPKIDGKGKERSAQLLKGKKRNGQRGREEEGTVWYEWQGPLGGIARRMDVHKIEEAKRLVRKWPRGTAEEENEG